ncbi:MULTISPECIES: hypothetical protein [unclassified Streptomyces]|uniref:hypothetical protein n=1 Tax=unclassified Streptomyces TaxID=2593676 RepID=UPI0033B572C3
MHDKRDAVESMVVTDGEGRVLRCSPARELVSDTVQAVAGLLSHQQTADLRSTRQT